MRSGDGWGAKLAVSAIWVVALTACASTPAPTHGTVVARRYDPPYEDTSQVCMSYNKYGGCTMSVPITNHHGPSWHLLIDGFDKNDEARKAWRTVDAETYENCERGDRFEVDAGC